LFFEEYLTIFKEYIIGIVPGGGIVVSGGRVVVLVGGVVVPGGEVVVS
jgi:hypothetical protein